MVARPRLRILLLALVGLGLAPTLGWASFPPFVRGECNSDGSFDIADPVFLLQFLFPAPAAPPPSCDDACDANDDGALNIADPVSMLNVLFLPGSPPLPPPYPDCGFDTTFDNLDCFAPGPGCGGGPLPFETITQGEFTGLSEQQTIVREEADWVALWALHASIFFPPPPLPPVDFTTEMVIVIVGPETGPSVTLTVTSVIEGPGEVIVDYEWQYCPSPLTVIVTPHHLVVAPRVDGNLVTFQTDVPCP